MTAEREQRGLKLGMKLRMIVAPRARIRDWRPAEFVTIRQPKGVSEVRASCRTRDL
jgi:hypothetical protein